MNRASFNFKQVLPGLMIGLVLGTVAGFFMAKHGLKQYISPFPAETASLQKSNALSFPAPDSQGLGADSNDSQASSGTHGSAGHPTVAAGGAGDDPVVAGDDDAAIYSPPTADAVNLIEDRTIIRGEVTSREIDEKTGEVLTTETLPDGSTANRDYRSDGTIKSEQVKQPDGSELDRSFFESGSPKAANVKQTDGSITSASYDSTGVPSELMRTFPDHTTIFNEYDDHGKIVGVWRHFPDGRTEPYGDSTETDE